MASTSSSRRNPPAMVWPKIQADKRALEVAGSNMWERRQRAPQHIPRYTLPVSATKEEFIQLMDQRHQRMTEVASIMIDGVPVTPPSEDAESTYHIVELKDQEEGSGVDILFREKDLYYIAFRPRFEGDGRNADPTGWFAFTDAIMPGFLNSNKIHYDSGYRDNINELVSMGSRCLKEIRLTHGGYTYANRMAAWAQRKRVHQAVMVMLAETFRSVQTHAIDNLDNGTSHPLGKVLAFRVGKWAVLSRCSLRHVDLEQKSSSLDEVDNYRVDLRNEQTGEKDFHLLVSPDRGEILIILFDKDLVLNIIKQRNRGVGRGT